MTTIRYKEIHYSFQLLKMSLGVFWSFFSLRRIDFLKTFPSKFLSLFSVSGFGDSDQPSGVDPDEAAVSETVIPGADWAHPLRSAGRGLEVYVARFGAHTLPRRSLLSHVLVQLWEGQELAVLLVQHQRTHVYHHLHVWSGVWLCECIWNWSAFSFSICRNSKVNSNLWHISIYFRLPPL